MNIKRDENLPERLVPVLTELGHDTDTVRGERLNAQSDPNVWSATQAAQRFFITQDLDFSDMRRYTPGLMPAYSSCAWRNRVAMRYLNASPPYSKPRTSRTGSGVLSS